MRAQVSLLPKRRHCDEFNNAMLNSLQSEVIEIACTDTVDETKGAHKWTPRAVKELEKLNRDSNLTAGLEAVLRIAVGAHVMLCRNIDTERGLVNGALGTIKRIQRHHVTMLLDDTKREESIEKVKNKFIVHRKIYVYREQFPLILAYAITSLKIFPSTVLLWTSPLMCSVLAWPMLPFLVLELSLEFTSLNLSPIQS